MSRNGHIRTGIYAPSYSANSGTSRRNKHPKGSLTDTPSDLLALTSIYMHPARRMGAMLEYAIAVVVWLGVVYGTVRLLWGDDIPNVIG